MKFSEAAKITGMILSSRNVQDIIAYCANSQLFLEQVMQAYVFIQESKKQE